MKTNAPPCEKVKVLAFRGDRVDPFRATFMQELQAEKDGYGPGPTSLDCLLFAGHTGVSTDGGSTFLGFNPDGGVLPVWKLMDQLKNGDRFPGIVRDDTAVFTAAQQQQLVMWSLEVVLPVPEFLTFRAILTSELQKSQFSYGFPNGDGDCNCTTWLERLGLPLLTGRMSEFSQLWSITPYWTRRFGECI